VAGQDRISDHWKANNPLHVARNANSDTLKTVRYYFDCGDDDFLYKGNAAAHVLFRDLEIPHEFRIRDGAHNWTYWRTGIVDALKFLGKSFHR
ncbi:MAG: esterase family protein, partial [Cyclobacteriaceae bacterium]|nr:esterase family protein [Cyclobacteriaceae bacterium]